ncbi:hypothetical protein PFTANZ_06226 [Plasmodium falciparum Tanzania (2000708)]|uniref:Surface antigen n=1 Tax=Plasmodium falciparum Tanzania (2000708) TaxID=1036725 RepID=A0A024VXK3_PLAFA|nr:hypothetical protein PFTANZ_06226 [Plasmodium falciparum Tanzania (2000708)]
MQRKLYNNFYAKPEIYFENFSDKTNDKSCECSNNMKSYNQLSSSNKVHDKYLDNLKEGCVGAVNTCTFSSALVGNIGTTIKTSNTTVSVSIELFPYGLIIIALIAVTVTVIFLYVWLCNRHKNSWKHECKKHLCK